MAKIESILPLIFGAEGGWSDNVHDHGGKTNMGITLSTWRCCGYDKDGDGDIDADDLRMLTKADVLYVLRKYYWNRCQADLINNQSVANLLVDWVWNSGSKGIKILQFNLGVLIDGVIGQKTIDALNHANQKELFEHLWQARLFFIETICKNNPDQQVFYDGWINRLHKFTYNG